MKSSEVLWRVLPRLVRLSKASKWWVAGAVGGGGGEVPECLEVKEGAVGAGAVVGGTHHALPAPQTLGGQIVPTLLPPNPRPAAHIRIGSAKVTC